MKPVSFNVDCRTLGPRRWFGYLETVVVVGVHLKTIISLLLVEGVKREDSCLGR